MLGHAKAQEEGQQAVQQFDGERLFGGIEALSRPRDHPGGCDGQQDAAEEQGGEMACDRLHPEAVGPAQSTALAQLRVGGHEGLRNAPAQDTGDKGVKAKHEHVGVQFARRAQLVGDEGVLGEGDDLADHREHGHHQEARDHGGPRPSGKQGAKGGW